AHLPGKSLAFGSAAQWYPYYQNGQNAYNNVSAGEVNGNAHALRMRNATTANTSALPPSHMEVLSRFAGTNAPATLSELMRRMPVTFGSAQNRNRLTTVNWHPDRVIGAPFLTLNRNLSNFNWDPTVNYPRLPANPPADVTNPASVQPNSD